MSFMLPIIKGNLSNMGSIFLEKSLKPLVFSGFDQLITKLSKSLGRDLKTANLFQQGQTAVAMWDQDFVCWTLDPNGMMFHNHQCHDLISLHVPTEWGPPAKGGKRGKGGRREGEPSLWPQWVGPSNIVTMSHKASQGIWPCNAEPGQKTGDDENNVSKNIGYCTRE